MYMNFVRLTHLLDIFHPTWHFKHCANIHTVNFPCFPSENAERKFFCISMAQLV